MKIERLSTRLYSTGNDELDDLLERAFCDGYEYAQKEYGVSQEITQRQKDYEDFAKEDRANRREKRNEFYGADKSARELRNENRADRRREGLAAKVVKDNESAREHIEGRMAERTKRQVNRLAGIENRMQKRTERADMEYGHLNKRMAERTKRAEDARRTGLLAKHYEDKKDRREQRYKRLDRKLQAKYGR